MNLRIYRKISNIFFYEKNSHDLRKTRSDRWYVGGRSLRETNEEVVFALVMQGVTSDTDRPTHRLLFNNLSQLIQ